MINYAHRGASQYAPENTMAAFYLALEMGADGIETDVRQTADGVPVLFHDKDILRVTGRGGLIAEMTYAGLLETDLGARFPKYKNERIVTLDDFLKYFGGKDIELAVEIKVPGIEEKTLGLIGKYRCADRCTVTAFELEILRNVRNIDRTIRLGHLTPEITREHLALLKDNRIGQICPRADLIDREKIALARSEGFSVRCWGVKTVDLMEKAIALSVDGMTINFPDILAGALGRKTAGEN